MAKKAKCDQVTSLQLSNAEVQIASSRWKIYNAQYKALKSAKKHNIFNH